MTACPACGYPNDDLEHRCERCGRKFEPPADFDDAESVAGEDVRDEDVIAGDECAEYELVGHAVAPSAAENDGNASATAEREDPEPADAPAIPAAKRRDEVWRAELSSRLQRFRERRAQMQESLPFPEAMAPPPAPDDPTPASPASGVDLSRKVIPFEEIRDARRGLTVTRPITSAQPVSDHVTEPPPAEVARTSTPAPSEASPLPQSRPAALPAEEVARISASAPGERSPLPQSRPSPPGPTEEVARTSTSASAEASLLPPPRPTAPPPVLPRPPRTERHKPEPPPGAPLQPLLSFDMKPPAARPLARAPARDEVEVMAAPVVARAMAAAMDLAVLFAGYALFFAAYTFTGGRFPVQRAALVGIGTAVALVAFVFYLVCLNYGARTPGMHWVGLEIVDFEGRRAPRGQRRLRLLGVLASFASLGVGFLWAVADEDGLTWHDRISRTCPMLTDSPFVPRGR